MQRTVSVLLTSFVAGLLMTGCPEKRVEKEDPATPTATDKAPTASDKSGADEKAAEDEHGEEADEHAEAPKDDQKAPRKRHPDKKAAGEEKDQGGW